MQPHRNKYWLFPKIDDTFLEYSAVNGKIRYMSSKNTARKLRLREYLRRYGLPN